MFTIESILSSKKKNGNGKRKNDMDAILVQPNETDTPIPQSTDELIATQTTKTIAKPIAVKPEGPFPATEFHYPSLQITPTSLSSRQFHVEADRQDEGNLSRPQSSPLDLHTHRPTSVGSELSHERSDFLQEELSSYQDDTYEHRPAYSSPNTLGTRSRLLSDPVSIQETQHRPEMKMRSLSLPLVTTSSYSTHFDQSSSSQTSSPGAFGSVPSSLFSPFAPAGPAYRAQHDLAIVTSGYRPPEPPEVDPSRVSSASFQHCQGLQPPHQFYAPRMSVMPIVPPALPMPRDFALPRELTVRRELQMPRGLDPGLLRGVPSSSDIGVNPMLRQLFERRHSRPMLPFYHLYEPGYPFSGGSGACRSRRRGGQVRFTGDQTRQLEAVFAGQKYITPAHRRQLAEKLALHEKQVKTWFQNRRAKWRKVNSHTGEEEGGGSEGQSSSSAGGSGRLPGGAAEDMEDIEEDEEEELDEDNTEQGPSSHGGQQADA